MVIRNRNGLFLGQVLWLHPVLGKCFPPIPVSLVVPSGRVFSPLWLAALGVAVSYFF